MGKKARHKPNYVDVVTTTPNVKSYEPSAKRQKLSDGVTESISHLPDDLVISSNSNHLDTSRPTAVFAPLPETRRLRTISVALPASILANSKRKLDLRTNLAGNISRALAVFCVDEVVIYDDGDYADTSYALAKTFTGTNSPVLKQVNEAEGRLTAFSHPAHFLAYLLSYQETPPFMRSRLWPVHENLKSVGLLPSVDIPSHLRSDEDSDYREGIVVSNPRGGTSVDCGLQQPVSIENIQIPVKTRVTLRLSHNSEPEIVSPSAPKEHGGLYWGWQIRMAGSLSAVFTDCAYDGGYDLSIGTSERGVALDQAKELMQEQAEEHKHLLIVFGGVKGLEDAAQNDADLGNMGISKGNVSELFDQWVNVCPGQGSRTIRTEEALWMGLMGLRSISQILPT